MLIINIKMYLYNQVYQTLYIIIVVFHFNNIININIKIYLTIKLII